jgi:opacity protein-like surface antigen
MKRLLAVPLIVVALASATRAQDQGPAVLGASGNVAADFAKTSAASASIPQSSDWTLASLNPPEAGLGVLSFSSLPGFSPAPAAPFASPAAAATATLADPSPAPPDPSFDYSLRDYRWEISLGFALVRFRSSVYYASLAGVHSSLAYFLNDWVAIEGAANTAFAPVIYQNEHVKYLGYGAGPRFSLGHHAQGRLEPWAHALVGGVHVLPQTGLGGKNGFELTAGAGADFNFNPRISARIEVDYLRTNLFTQSQNSAQGSIGVVFHF